MHQTVVIEYRPHEVAALEAALILALDEGAQQVVLDLDSLESLDTDGIRGLIALLRRARAQGARLGLQTSKPAVLRTLEVTALNRIFDVVEVRAA